MASCDEVSFISGLSKRGAYLLLPIAYCSLVCETSVSSPPCKVALADYICPSYKEEQRAKPVVEGIHQAIQGRCKAGRPWNRQSASRIHLQQYLLHLIRSLQRSWWLADKLHSVYVKLKYLPGWRTSELCRLASSLDKILEIHTAAWIEHLSVLCSSVHFSS